MTRQLGRALLVLGTGLGAGLLVLGAEDWRVLSVAAMLGLGLATLLAAWHLPVAVFVLMVLLPFGEYPSIVSPGRGWLAIGPAMTAIVVAGWALGALMRRRAGPPGRSSLWWVTAALGGWIGLLVFHPDGAGFTARIEGAALRAVPIGLFFVSRSLPWESSRFTYRLWWLILGTGVAVSLFGLRQYFLWLSPAEEMFVAFTGPNEYGDVALRVFGTFRGSWQLACYLGLVLMVVLALWASGRPWYRACTALALVPVGLALAFTYARGPVVGLVGTLVVVLALRSPGVRTVQRVGGVALVVLAIGIALQAGMLHELEASEYFGPLAARVRSLADPFRDEAVRVRFETWRALGTLAVEQPLGIGLASTGGLSIRYEDKLRLGVLHPDNYYLDTVLTTGWLGLALLVAITVLALRRAATVAGYEGLPGSIGLVVTAWFALVTLANLTNQFTTNPVIGGYVWLGLGAVDRLYQESGHREGSRSVTGRSRASRPTEVTA